MTAQPLEDLEADMLSLTRICTDDPEALDLLDQAVQGRQGERADLLDNRQEVKKEEALVGTLQPPPFAVFAKTVPICMSAFYSVNSPLFYDRDHSRNDESKKVTKVRVSNGDRWGSCTIKGS